MKVIFTLLLAVVYSTALWSQDRTFKNLVGVWEAVDSENQSGGLEFIDSQKIYLVYGKEKKPITSCKFDFDKSPGWFDFVVVDSAGMMTLKSLLLFVNDDLIQWQVFDGEARPAHFTEAQGQMVYLRRKKQ
ncbi:MAG TPA: hypothetical protein VGE66_00670 [Chitinophagaceae bacterium]